MPVVQTYRPVIRARRGNYNAAALVGVNSIILGWNVNDSVDRTDLLGFGVKRTYNTERIVEYGLSNSTARRKIEQLNRRYTRFFTPSKLKPIWVGHGMPKPLEVIESTQNRLSWIHGGAIRKC